MNRVTQMIQSYQSINSISVTVSITIPINQQHYMLTFFGKSSILLTYFGKRSTSLNFLGYFESIQLIQSYQSLKVNRLGHLLYGNELTQSPINSLGKGTESIQSILQKNKSIQINQLSRVDCNTSLVQIDIPFP